uniref:Transmembrane protein 65 n=1 Tax=Monopterus albus TaxID=43700 RepID=A0A3Q3J761_MONAL
MCGCVCKVRTLTLKKGLQPRWPVINPVNSSVGPFSGPGLGPGCSGRRPSEAAQTSSQPRPPALPWMPRLLRIILSHSVECISVWVLPPFILRRDSICVCTPAFLKCNVTLPEMPHHIITQLCVCVCSLAGYVEVLASKLGMQVPDLTPKQADMWQTRLSSHMGKAIGVSIGCILGMFPLLFLDDEKEKEA